MRAYFKNMCTEEHARAQEGNANRRWSGHHIPQTLLPLLRSQKETRKDGSTVSWSESQLPRKHSQHVNSRRQNPCRDVNDRRVQYLLRLMRTPPRFPEWSRIQPLILIPGTQLKIYPKGLRLALYFVAQLEETLSCQASVKWVCLLYTSRCV